MTSTGPALGLVDPHSPSSVMVTASCHQVECTNNPSSNRAAFAGLFVNKQQSRSDLHHCSLLLLSAFTWCSAGPKLVSKGFRLLPTGVLSNGHVGDWAPAAVEGAQTADCHKPTTHQLHSSSSILHPSAAAVARDLLAPFFMSLLFDQHPGRLLTLPSTTTQMQHDHCIVIIIAAATRVIEIPDVCCHMPPRFLAYAATIWPVLLSR